MLLILNLFGGGGGVLSFELEENVRIIGSPTLLNPTTLNLSFSFTKENNLMVDFSLRKIAGKPHNIAGSFQSLLCTYHIELCSDSLSPSVRNFFQ